MGDVAFSLRLRSVTWMSALAPAGITAPFDPTTAFVTVAVKRSPGLLVFVQIRSFDVRLIAVPAGTVPSAPSVPGELVETELPDGVVVGAAGAGVEDDGARVLGFVLRAGAGRRAGAAGAAAAADALSAGGTSFSCGCAALSAFAICRSRVSLESCASVPFLPLSLLHPPATSATDRANGARTREMRAMIVSRDLSRMDGKGSPT